MAQVGDYRIRWANVRYGNGRRITTVRMCIGERRFRWFGWWPVTDWRSEESDAMHGIEADRALRTPLPKSKLVPMGQVHDPR